MPRWILELHPDFPSSETLRVRLKDPVILERQEVLKGSWPELDGPLVGYGTMFTMTRLRRHPQLNRAVFDDYQILRCSAYYRWTYDLLGRNCILVPLKAVPSLPLERMFASDHIFLRSDSNYKLFPAAVHSLPGLPEWIQTYQTYQDELVVLSEVVEILQEYRCFCSYGRYVCGSSYPDPPFQPPPTEVRVMAEQTALRMVEQGLSLASIDLAECADGRLRLVELGGVNSWGLYGSDPDAFIAALESKAREDS